MRTTTLLFSALLLLPGCFIFGGGRDDVDVVSDDDSESLRLGELDINCSQDQVEFEADVSGASEVEVEFWVDAELAYTFELVQLDDRTWIGDEPWPAGTSFADCSGTVADWVLVARNDAGHEEREAH